MIVCCQHFQFDRLSIGGLITVCGGLWLYFFAQISWLYALFRACSIPYGYLWSFAANISNSTDYRLADLLRSVAVYDYIFAQILGFMLYFEHTAFHILAAFIYAGVLLRWGGGFRLYMYPRVGLASSPVPARACFTTRSTMRVSSEDTESSDLHVHAGYPITN